MLARIRSVFSSIDLRHLDRRRIDLAMAWAQRHPLATAVYNLGNYLFLGIVKAGLWGVKGVQRVRQRLLPGDDTGTATDLPPPARPPRVLPAAPRILLLAEDSIPQCFEYRVQQKLDMFTVLGWEAEWRPWSDIDTVARDLHFFDVILLYRVPGFDAVLSIIDYARALNKLLIYDLDDLVFDRAQLEKKFSQNRGQLSRKVYRDLLTGADLYRKAMARIPYCIVSTDALRQEVEALGDIQGFVLPNGISSVLARLAATGTSTFADGKPDAVVVFYGSGTKTHDADFMLITPILLELLAHHPQLELVIAGPVQIDPRFEKYEGRVSTIEFLDYPSYLEMLACADINIAPLEEGVFADCKSEIKWLEAGMLGLPSVVSTTRTYSQVLHHGDTGFLASRPEEWREILSTLIDDADLRRRTGHAAREHIARHYGVERLAPMMKAVLDQCIDSSPELVRADPGSDSRRRLLLVNTLYPPQAMGGATRIVKNLADGLLSRYPGKYDISVFTCDVHDTHPYRLREYVHDGIVVTSVSVPMRPDLERLYHDDRMCGIFRSYLTYTQPDIVHFHSIQRLTASVLEAAADAGVPHLVSLHDSWWISDHPFMIDDQGRLLPPNISNPLLASSFSSDVNATVARNRYLRERLSAADALVSVSDYQQELYSRNGYASIVVENGVDKPNGFTPQRKDKLVLGYVGGESTHKGYYFLKENIARAALEHIEVACVDIFAKTREITTSAWGNTVVRTYPRFDFARTGEFYSMVDVVVVPSLWPESFGLVVREASLLGRWVVATDIGGLSGAVIDGKTGFTFAPGDGQALQRILAELDTNWQRYQQPVPAKATAELGIRSIESNVEATHAAYAGVLDRT